MTRSLARQLEQVRGLGRPLDLETAMVMGDLFGHDFSRVRIHIGAGVDCVADQLGALAFCVGTGVFVRSDAMDERGCVRSEVLQHELAHLAIGEDGNRIRCWMPENHRNLTRQAAVGVIRDGAIVAEIVDASTQMDMRAARLASIAARMITYKAGLTGYPAEGAEHGEAGMYTEPNEAVARSGNLALWRSRLQTALNSYREWAALMDGMASSTGAVLRQMSQVNVKRRAMVENLGDALHIAQDRGSHSEGVRGRGHDDPRCAQGWNPDDPGQNTIGFANAQRYTRETFDEFRRMVQSVQRPGSTIRLFQ